MDFPLVPGLVIEGFHIVPITVVEPSAASWGDCYVYAPDGSEAELMWLSGQEEPSCTQLAPPGPVRWGDWKVCVTERIDDDAGLVHVLASVVDNLRPTWETWRRSRES